MNTENTGPAGSADNTRTIARNSFWYGLELLFNIGAAVVTSIAVARVVGPERLKPYAYIGWLTNVTISVGAFGLPVTTRKYMAEYLNRGESGVARATYLATLKIQSLIALGVSVAAAAVVFLFGTPGYLAVSLLLVAAMAPRMIGTIPSQANNAAEAMQRNTVPAVIGGIVSTVLTIATLLLCRLPALRGSELIGVSLAVVAGSYLECALKLRSVESWLGGVVRGTVSPELKKRMFAYSRHGLALMLLNVVVWEKSDIIILNYMNGDGRQVSYFSIAFNLVERLLMIPVSFGTSMGATMMAQVGRGQARLKGMTTDGARYALLLALPLLLGMACIARPVIQVYGKEYAPMIATLTIAALMAIPKALVAAPTMLLQSTERQGFLIWWGCLCGVVDIGLDFLLTPAYGANGAAIANGTAQTMAAIGIWIYVWRTCDLDLRLRDFGRILLSGAIMAGGVVAFTRAIPGYAGMAGGIALGAVLWMIALRITGALRPDDVSRFGSVSRQVPTPLRPYWKRLIAWLAPAGATA